MRRVIAAVGDLSDPVEYINVIKISGEGIGREAHDTRGIGREVADTDELIAGIEGEITNPSRAKIRMKISVVVFRRKATARVPGAPDRTVTRKLWAGNGRPIGSEIDHIGIIAVENP